MADDPCAAEVGNVYDLPLHIASVFIIMFCSFAGTCLPIVAKKFPSVKLGDIPFACAKMFGSGVIITTALVHMFSPADQNLTNPCLPPTFTQDYTAFAGAICLFAILSLQLIQFLVSRELRQVHKYPTEPTPNTNTPKIEEVEMKDEKHHSHADHSHQEKGHTHHSHEHHSHDHSHDDHAHGHELILRKEIHISTYILELGIASHSIIIGIALGVSHDPEFHSLIVALVFHQFFEGMALSTVVLDSKFDKSLPAIIMVVFYTLTTPIGISIGIGINSSFNANATSSLIAQGVLDALSAGILLYDCLVNILPSHFKSEKIVNASGIVQFSQFGFLWLGAAVMALIGRWA